MRKIFSKCLMVSGLSIVAGCGVAQDHSARIEIDEANAFGVVSLQTERLADGDNEVFVLRAFAADGQERASVQLTTGAIAGLPQYLPGEDSMGSEIVVSVAGVPSRLVTRETEVFVVSSRALDNPAASAFLGLPAVSATLAREAHVVVDQLPQVEEVPQFTALCSSAMLLTSPLAQECCYDGSLTAFHRADEAIVIRNSGGSMICKAYGGGACSGASCYWGPFGFARPMVSTAYAGGEFAKIYVNTLGGSGGICAWSHQSTNPPRVFGDMGGTNPVGQGCPGGATGAYQWDY